MAGQDPTQVQVPSMATVPYGGYSASVPGPDLMQQIQAVSQGIQGLMPQMPGGNVPFMPQAQISPNMPVAPQMVPMQQMQQIPAGQGATLQDRRTVNAQNWGSMLGNAIGTVANKKLQENYQKNVKTISDATNYLQAVKNAQQLKQMYPNNPEVQKMADAAIAQNQQGFDNLTADPKTSKMIGKALSWDFTNPKHMQTPEVKAGQEGVKLATDQNRVGINAITPQDKRIQDMLDKGQQAAKGVGAMGQGLGAMPQQLQPARSYAQPSPWTPEGQKFLSNIAEPPTAKSIMGGAPPTQAMQAGMPSAQPGVRPQNRMEQYLAQLPSNLVPNPAYAAQQAFEQQTFRDIITKIGPSAYREAQMTARADAKNAATLIKDYNDNLTKVNMNDKRIEGQLRQQYARNAGLVEQQRARANVLAQGVTNRGTAQSSGMMAVKEFQQISSSMDRLEGDNSKIQGEIKRLEDDRLLAKSAGENQRAEYDEEQIRQNKARFDANSRTLDNMGPVRDSFLQTMTQGGYKMDDKGNASYDPQMAALAFGQQAGEAGGGAVTTPGQVAGMGGTRGAPYGSTGSIAPALSGPKINPRQMEQWNGVIDGAARQYGVDANLVASIIQIESSGDPGAVSRSGATGMGQFTRDTGKQYGLMTDEDRRNPVKNIEATAHYISDLINKNQGDVAKAIGDYYGWTHPVGEPTAAQHIAKVLGEYQRRGGGFDPQSARFAVGDFSQSGEAQGAAKPVTTAAAKPAATPTAPTGTKQPTVGQWSSFWLGGGSKAAAPTTTAQGAPTKPGDDDSAGSEEDDINRRSFQ